jgi:hypothetical protein
LFCVKGGAHLPDCDREAFLARQGKRELLLPINPAGFPEGFDTLDLDEAKALLNVINVYAPIVRAAKAVNATDYNPLTKR